MTAIFRATLAAFMFGFAATAQASVVSVFFSTPTVINNDVIGFDVDNDGYEDIGFDHLSETSVDDSNVDVDVLVYATWGVANEVTTGDYADSFTLPFTPGSLIDGSLSFDCGCGSVAASNYYDIDNSVRTGNYGYWANAGAAPGTWPGAGAGYLGYLGFAFLDFDYNIHYGWALMGIKPYSPSDLSSFEVSVYGYGYETEVEKGIAAGAVPEPGSLLLLGIGGIGLFLRKRPIK